MHFGFMDVFLLRGAQQHVSATHVTIFRVVKTRKQILNWSKSLHSYKRNYSFCLKFKVE